MKKHNGWISYTDKSIKDIQLGVEKYERHNEGFSHQYTARELRNEDLKGFFDNVVASVNNGKRHFDGDFFIEVERAVDRVIPDHERRLFVARNDCPKPFYDQAVYKYYRDKDEVELLWNLPDFNYAEELRYKIADIEEGEKELREYISKFHNRELAIRVYNENQNIDHRSLFARNTDD